METKYEMETNNLRGEVFEFYDICCLYPYRHWDKPIEIPEASYPQLKIE